MLDSISDEFNAFQKEHFSSEPIDWFRGYSIGLLMVVGIVRGEHREDVLDIMLQGLTSVIDGNDLSDFNEQERKEAMADIVLRSDLERSNLSLDYLRGVRDARNLWARLRLSG